MFMDDTKGNICGRTDEAAALLGISVRTAGFDGQFDYLLVQPSANRAEDSEVQKMTRLYEDRYHRFNVKHFHEYAQREHRPVEGMMFHQDGVQPIGGFQSPGL